MQNSPDSRDILIVEDDPGLALLISKRLTSANYSAHTANTGKEAFQSYADNPPTLMLLDYQLPDMTAEQLVRNLTAEHKNLNFIVITGHGNEAVAVAMMKLGAIEYVIKDEKFLETLPDIVHNAFREIETRKRLAIRYSLDNIIGQCFQMQQVFDTIGRVAQAPCTVLITGESGTGKDLVAQAIHENSNRRKQPFIPINCGSIPESLLESELFGHVKGAFTGAVMEKQGLIQAAQGGTLFLDEVGDMPLSLQVRLLRLIQNRQIQKVGSTKMEQVDVRIISATHQNLEEKIEQGLFRRDLYYRINVVKLDLPPLRKRGSDISLLVSHFIKKFNKKVKRNINHISPAAARALQRYPWPGNVRELENALEHALTMCDQDTIRMEDLPFAIADYANRRSPANKSLKLRMEIYEMQAIEESLKQHNYDTNAVSRELDISLATLYRKLKKFNLPGVRKIVDLPDNKKNTSINTQHNHNINSQ